MRLLDFSSLSLEREVFRPKQKANVYKIIGNIRTFGTVHEQLINFTTAFILKEIYVQNM